MRNIILILATLIVLIVTVIFAVIMYASFGFITSEVDSMNWNKGVKGIFLLLVVGYSAGIIDLFKISIEYLEDTLT